MDHKEFNLIEQPKKRGRGKGVKPALVYIGIRLPADVIEFYKEFANPNQEMRRVLTYYAQVNKQLDGQLINLDLEC